MKAGEVCMLMNVPTKGKDTTRAGFKMRNLAEQLKVANFTCPDTLEAYIMALKMYRSDETVGYETIDAYC